MRPPPPLPPLPLASSLFLLLQCLFLFTLFGLTFAQHTHPIPQHHQHRQSHNDSSDKSLICVPVGPCEPCPQESLHEPYCQPFGNRKLMHCQASPNSAPNSSPISIAHTNSPTSPPTSPPPPPSSPPFSHLLPPIPAYESCGRLVPQERHDFFEFLLCNISLGLLALFILFARSKRLKARQARYLAVRIGLVREPQPGGWSTGSGPGTPSGSGQ